MIPAPPKTDTISLYGPYATTTSIRQINFAFEPTSMGITNNSTTQLLLHPRKYPANLSEAVVVIEPRMIYGVQGWKDRQMYISTVAPLAAGEYIIIQISDIVNPSPNALMITSPIPVTAAADALANPTSQEILAFPFVWNGTTWDRQREPTADALAVTGLLGVGPMVWNGATWDRQREPTADGVAATGLIATGPMIFDSIQSDWTRQTNARVDGQALKGIPLVNGAVLNVAGGVFNRVREPASDALAVTGIPAQAPMVWNGANWDRMRGPTDGVIATGIVGTNPMLYNTATARYNAGRSASADALPDNGLAGAGLMVVSGTGNWDRVRETADGLTSNIGILGVSPLLVGSNFNRAREAASSILALASGQGVQLVVEPGHWVLEAAPSAGAQASVTRAAVAGTRHVLRTIYASFDAGLGAPGAAQRQDFFVRDGATGVGPILWEGAVAIQNLAGDRDRIQLSGLSLIGSVNTAMTVEFGGVGVANTVQRVSCTGYEAT